MGALILKTLKSLIPDLLIIFGALCISYGAFKIYRPAGFICLGVMLIGGAVLIIKGGDDA